MITIQNTLFVSIAAVVILGLLTACEEWTEPEAVGYTTTPSTEQNPELYARYTESLRAYKQNPHFLVFGRMNSASGNKTNEKDYLRSLPDSLDIITFMGADSLSDFDRKDMADIQQIKGTKVLYGIDLTQRKNEFEEKGNLTELMSTYLDEAVKKFSEEKFDGISIFYEGDLGLGDNENIEALKQTLVTKLTPIAGLKANNGKLLVFEGNPIFIPESNRADFNYYIINTTEVKDAHALKLDVAYANEYVGIPKEKLLLSAIPGGTINDVDNNLVKAIPVMASLVISAGPVGGLSIINIGEDYYNPSKNYQQTCEAIQFLNPSPLK